MSSEAKQKRQSEYAGCKEQGAHGAGKPIVPAEECGKSHSGRPLPEEEEKLSGSKILGGRLANAMKNNCETANL